MRRVILASGLAAIAALILAVPAFGISRLHFSVLAITRSQHPGPHGTFVFRDRLFFHHRRVGHDLGRCRRRTRTRLHCRVVFVFPPGNIKAVGRIRFGRHGLRDNKLPIVGGTRAFNGVGGKLLIHGIRGRRTRLEFFLVG